MRRILSILLLLHCLGAYAQKNIQWHHPLSPCRACYEIQGRPTLDKAGAVLSIPVCGLGKNDGSDVFCYGSGARQLPSRPLGKGTYNGVLVQVQVPASETTVFAYFGSGQMSPVSRDFIGTPLCSVYTLPPGKTDHQEDVLARLKDARLLGQLPVQVLEEMCNPVTSDERFLMVLTAELQVPSPCERHFFLVSDDAGYVFIDGKSLIQRDGIHGVWDALHAENKKTISLTAGLHSIRIVAANYEKLFSVVLGEWFPQPKTIRVPASDYIQGAKAKLIKVENRQKYESIPVFWYRHLAYMPIGKEIMTLTFLGTYSGKEADWQFSDGIRMKGATIQRIFAGLDTKNVKAQIRNLTTSGEIMFPEMAPPRALLPNNDQDFAEFAKTLPEDFFQNLRDFPELLIFFDFFLHKALHPGQVPVCEALLQQNNLSPALRIKALTALAGAAAKNSPEKSLLAYYELLKSKLSAEQTKRICQDAFEFSLFRLQDFQVAESILNLAAPKLSEAPKLLTAMRFDLALQKGEQEKARTYYQSLLEGHTQPMERRIAAVQGNSLQSQVADLLRDGRIVEAETALRTWAETSPQDRDNGSFSLARARCFRQRGWHNGAIQELNAAIQAEPLLPNLPDVEFELAINLRAIGDKAKAQALFTKIATDYPNHPLAQKAVKEKDAP